MCVCGRSRGRDFRADTLTHGRVGYVESMDACKLVND